MVLLSGTISLLNRGTQASFTVSARSAHSFLT